MEYDGSHIRLERRREQLAGDRVCVPTSYESLHATGKQNAAAGPIMNESPSKTKANSVASVDPTIRGR
ncbi:Rab-GAP TBC domain-containing protein [Plasmodiophora brassicae]